ncbi:S9 family peptidase [Parapedobacter koreensis]|uniref:Dipeptidyl aminopeptidase/acylaminoacyl peptidase n=1 Tax=Parapedobacter koreensis TaxID=332977 RepID=A0A1H7QDN4_9SPHI|nr:prolyl oligopeptidase family serine peptidase [Parapedobacter koreensis]SEL46026.1 Dipeptidyl aminopeptidase/acylaminoacyl peptidase [Parapedobacter koreensis]
MLKKLLSIAFIGAYLPIYAQQGTLTVEKIMRDPKWMGISPSGAFWDVGSNKLFFSWNPEAAETASLYYVTTSNHTPEQASDPERQGVIRQYSYDKSRSRIVFERAGDIYIRELKSGNESQLTKTVSRESNPLFTNDGQYIIFQQGDDLFRLSLSGREWEQLTHFSRGDNMGRRGSGRAGKLNEQDKWLQTDQLELFDVLKVRKRRDSIRTADRENTGEHPLRALDIGDAMLSAQQLSPDGRYLTYLLTKRAEGNRNTIVPNYVTESGYTEDIPGRTKVGNALPVSHAYIYDQQRDTVYEVDTKTIPGIKDLPDYLADYPDRKAKLQGENNDRQVSIGQVSWNESGTAACVVVTSADNKDRWIMRLDAETGTLHLVDRQRDEAWIAGPGIGRSWGTGNIGWLDDTFIYFQSEASGYSHIYTANIRTGEKRQLTEGKWEVSDLQLAADKQYFYFTANKKHPGITHFYRLPIQGGDPVQVTHMDGGSETVLSPDEKWLAIRYSYSNKPWELYLQENKPGAKATKITESLTEEFKAYAWREPEVISFKNRFGDDVYARVYQPANPKPSRPAVVFVHGAGYLQNVHYWWSQYSREYMFHNLLVDKGYTVLDIDYTGSSGYGRDHRTGIYRHMGGKDLSDHVDGVKLLVEKYGVNPKNVGLYGGSYGGFITLMAMFNEPDVFAAGAALRSVTDWAHYNHGYTANILNEPADDPIAYQQSSPIYFADGLKGYLLMCHGMVDVNVHFQDIVRVSQRLIELGKDNWELAVYPVEDHGFVEPSSWTDEYKRILKLFEERLNN